jgi:hypothetical protein
MPPESAGGLAVDGVGQTDHVDVLAHVRIDLRGIPLGPLRTHGERDVAAHRQPRHQRMALEHHTALKARPRHLALVHEHMAAAGRLQSCQRIEDGGLAAAGVADDADELAAFDGEVHILEHRFGGRPG